MKDRKNITSGTKWEDIVGYSRAVRIGNIVEISGTVAVKNGKIVGPKDPYIQAKRIFQIIESNLRKAGATLKDVIRTRMYVTDISRWDEVGKAHYEIFKAIKPATSMIEVKSLIDQEFMVEIEVTAVVSLDE